MTTTNKGDIMTRTDVPDFDPPTYEFVDGVLSLPNGDTLHRHGGSPTDEVARFHYTLRGPKGGIRHAFVELWVHGGRAHSEEQFLMYLNGDAHDQSKCQVLANPGLRAKFWDVS